VARVCERHTGTGLTPEVIKARELPLPEGDYRPETLEEQLVCYADKYYSKSHPDRIRSAEDTAKSLEKFGHEGVGMNIPISCSMAACSTKVRSMCSSG
jgi:uncharacterized protein